MNQKRSVVLGVLILSSLCVMSCLVTSESVTVPLPAPTTKPATAKPTTPPITEPAPAPASGRIANGDFELGRDGSWQEYNSRPDFLALVRPGHSVHPPIVPTSGEWLAGLFAREIYETSQIWQSVTLPASETVYLRFNYLIFSKELCEVKYYDFINIYINDTRIASQTICRSDSMDNWETASFDISNFAQQTVEIKFEARAGRDGGMDTAFCLDDISIETAP